MDASGERSRQGFPSAGSENGEERLLALLEAYDERLARGVAAPDDRSAAHDLPAELSARFEQACKVLAGFECARRAVGKDTADDGRRSADTAPIALAPAKPLDAAIENDESDRLVLKHLGRYEIVRELGRGAFGIVFLANDPLLRRQVALKVPRPEVLLTAEARRRFGREAQAAARLTHPNLVPVYETGEVGPICYIAAMYCEGRTLAAWLAERHEPVSQAVAAKIVARLADGVAYSHSQGVLHRDIKPTNVLLESCHGVSLATEFEVAAAPVQEAVEFTPKLTDFGLAKIEEFSAGETRTGAVIGTPTYMAPEQAAGRSSEVGPPADIYALGTLLYELLTRRAPFIGSSDAETLHRVIADEPIKLSKLRRDIAPDLEAICLKCLEKQPSLRYPSCAALAADLRRFLAGEPTRARPASPAERLFKWSRRRPAVAALVAVSFLAAVTIAAGSGVFSWRLASALESSEGRRAEAVLAWTEAERHRQQALRERDANEQYAYAGRMHQAFQALAQGNVKQVSNLLSSYEEGTPYAGLRGFEWHYLKRTMRGDRMMLSGHAGQVYGVAFAPDGRLLASGGEDGTIRLWEPASGQLLRTISAHKSCTNDLDFSPDGRLLVSGGCDHAVMLWDTAAWREIAACRGHDDNVLCVSFSPDGSRFATGDTQGWVRIWGAPGGEPIAALKAAGDRAAVNAVAWSPDGAKLVAACQGVRAWDATTWDEVGFWRVDGMLAVAFAPDGKRLALNQYSGAEIRDVAMTRTLAALPSSTHHIQRLAFSPDGGQLLTCGDDRLVRICRPFSAGDDHATAATPSDPQWPRSIRVLYGHEARVQDLAMASDGRTLATASFDGRVGLWDLEAKGGAVPVLTCTARAVYLEHPLALSADLCRLTVHADDGQFVTWDVAKAREVSRQQTAAGTGRAVFIAPDAETLVNMEADRTGLSFGTVHNPSSLVELETPLPAIRQFVFSAGSQFVALAHVDGRVRVLDTRTGKLRYSFTSREADMPGGEGFANNVRLALSSDGSHLAVMNAENILVDLNADESRLLPPAEGPISEMHFSPDDRMLAVRCHPGIVHLVDLGSGETVRTLRSSPPARVISWSPNSKTLALATHEKVTLWHVETGQELGSFVSSEGTGDIFQLQFSADCRQLAVAAAKPIDDARADVFLHTW